MPKTYTLNIGKLLLDLRSGKKSIPPPPCADCQAACCTQQGSIAISLQPEELNSYEHDNDQQITMVNGRCYYLNEDNRCSIYDKRPQICRSFNCVWSDLLLPQHQLVNAGKPKMIIDKQETPAEKKERQKHEKTLKQVKPQRFNGDVSSALKAYWQYRSKHG